MLYHIKRFYHGIWKIRRWLPLVFIASLIYVIIAAMVPDRFSVIQKITINKSTPVAVSKTPVDTMPMEKIINSPAELFLDDFAIRELTRSFEQLATTERKEYLSNELRQIVEDSLTIRAADDEHILMIYYGSDIKLGKMMVNFYTQKLMGRAKDGLMRSIRGYNANLSPRFQPSQPDAALSETLKPKPQPEISGELNIEEHRAFWRPDRLLSTIEIFTVSLLLFIIVAAVLEWSDPSFKSERQVARYLGIPIIGVMPDIDQLIRRLQKNS